jgi:hypothetical protein
MDDARNGDILATNARFLCASDAGARAGSAIEAT